MTGAFYDYSQPLSYVASDSDVVVAPDATNELFEQARQSFRDGAYNAALDQIDQAISRTPNDPALHEFRSVVLFALQRYPDAASTLYAVLSVGPGMNWSSMNSLYPSVATYTAHLRSLEAFARQNPDEAAPHFVLGYHYVVGGHRDAALNQFQMASRLAPQDQVASQMVRLLSPSEDPATGENLPPAEAPDLASQPAREPVLTNPVGQFRAQAPAGGEIALTLDADKHFVWIHQNGDRTQKFAGTYEIEGDSLALDFSDGGGMVGVVQPRDQGFHFAIVNGPDKDPGLNFSRQR